MEGNNVVDVSSFLSFEEATGDSDETNHNSEPTTASDLNSDDNIGVVMDDDDAESCSWDLSDSRNQIDDDGQDDVHDDHKEWREKDDDEEEEEEEIRSVYNKKWDGKRSIGMSIDNHQKSSVSVDSTKDDFEPLNEMERNRLFWEACLAS